MPTKWMRWILANISCRLSRLMIRTFRATSASSCELRSPEQASTEVSFGHSRLTRSRRLLRESRSSTISAISSTALGCAKDLAAADICCKATADLESERRWCRPDRLLPASILPPPPLLRRAPAPGIYVLVIVRGARKRNEDRRLARCRDFCDRAGAGAADQQIGAREHAWHVVDELVNFAAILRLR